MNNKELQNLIGGWFPNSEADKGSEVMEHSDSEEVSAENSEASKLINASQLEFTEEESH